MAADINLELRPIKSKRLAETVVIALEEPILNGKLKDGDRLPSEEQLAVQLGVGRRAVREALKVLETKGLVEVQMGVGTVVRRTDLDNYLKNLSRNVSTYLYVNRAQAEHVMQLRLLLEGSALEHLATVPDPERLQRLRAAVAKQREALGTSDWPMYQDWHFQFHHGIVDGLDNPIISMLYRQVMSLMRPPMERAGALPARTVQTIRDHEQMLDAVERGDVAGVRTILHKHLQGFFVNVQDKPEKDGSGQPNGQG